MQLIHTIHNTGSDDYALNAGDGSTEQEKAGLTTLPLKPKCMTSALSLSKIKPQNIRDGLTESSMLLV
jgi:hypothetical protein